MKVYSQQIILVLVTTGLYFFYLHHNKTIDFESCELCDAREYNKLYNYFETGESSQISYPFYTRPAVPFLASSLPGNNVTLAFHIINFIFILLSVLTINKLWSILKLKPWLKWIGFGWLLTHWSGLIRYNLFDHITVDVPLYFVQPLALILYYRKNFKWFYFLAPLAILQKESFLAIVLILLFLHIWNEKSSWFKEGKHLICSILIALIVQKGVLSILPDQLDQRSSLMAILYHGRWALEDPSRFIRWFAAFGGAFGVFPFIVAFEVKSISFNDSKIIPLLVLSSMYMAFGLLAGEDMTRILFLGFPFIITLSLLLLQKESKRIIIIFIILSLAPLRLYPFSIDTGWAVDYAPIAYVYKYAIYYLVALVISGMILLMSKRKNQNSL